MPVYVVVAVYQDYYGKEIFYDIAGVFWNKRAAEMMLDSHDIYFNKKEKYIFIGARIYERTLEKL